MADDKVILEVDISSLSQAVIKAQADLEMYNSALEQSIEETGKWSEKTVAATAAVNAQNKAVKQAEGTLLRVTQAEKALGSSIQDIVKNYDASNKSIDQNRKVLNALTADYIKQVNPSKQLTERIKGISDTLKQQEGVIGDTGRNVGNYFNEFAKGVPQLGAAVEGVKGLGVAFTAAGGGLRGFGAALATTGLPLLILGVNSLIDAFRTFEPLANAVNDIMAGLSASFATSYAEGVKLSQLKRELADQDRLNLVNNAELKKSISDLETQAKNKAPDDKDRIRLLEEANKKRLELLETEKKAAEGALEVADKEVKQSLESSKTKASALGILNAALGKQAVEIKANDEALDKQAQAKARIIEIETAYSQQVTENRNKIDELTESFNKNTGATNTNKKAAEESAKAWSLQGDALIKAKTDYDNLIEARNKADEEGLAQNAKTQDALVKQNASALAKIGAQNTSSAEDQIKLEEQKEQAKQSIMGASFQFVTNLISQIGGALQAESEKELEQLDSESEARREQIERELKTGVISRKDYDRKLLQLDKEKAEKESAIKKRQWEDAKAIQIVNAIISTAQAVISGLNAGFSLGPAGVVAGPVLAALAAATGIAQLAIISAQQPPAFAKGVIGLDGEGTETSDSIPARLSKGESVLTAKATAKYHRQLAYMEMSVGNKPNYQFGHGHFATGFIPSGISDGGFTARQTMQASDSAAMIQNAIKSGFALAPSPKLSIVELEGKQDSRNRSVRISEA